MTREEKIEVMFESILLELEKITNALGKGSIGKVQNPGSLLENKFDDLLLKLGAIKIPVYKPDLNPIQKKLDEIMETLTNGNVESIHAKNLRFPSWFFRTRSNKIGWMFGLLFLASIGFNYYMAKDFDRFRQNHFKYLFIYHSGNKEYLQELDSLWQIDSQREQRLQFIKDNQTNEFTSTINHKPTNQ